MAKAIVGVEERSLDSPVSIVGGGRIAGETASHDDFALGEKVVFLLMLVAGFNLFIGLFNFIPLLPLDGGHIAGALWEAIRRGLARLSGRPDPGYVDVAKLLPIAYAVAAVLLVMGVVLIVGDLVVPIHLQSLIAGRGRRAVTRPGLRRRFETAARPHRDVANRPPYPAR